ncbi:MAG: RsmF rRNA methyltransferase first C-terminal domain-containing protein [Chitinophagales bacterium]|nr:RsmF rRNA methyltransferase first C-terminal domain-containing protein [Chitinophagales bacterium]
MNYPAPFIDRMVSLLGKEAKDFFSSLQQDPPVSVRINPFKPVVVFNGSENIPWAERGRYLPTRPSFTFDPHFHAGAYYVQEASSMFLEQAWKVINKGNKPLRVLDLCAAPGGKSTHLLSLMNDDSLLVSNEVIANRNAILRENIAKWGVANVAVTQNKPQDFEKLQNYFDIVLIDAPCSGEGLFRKDADAVNEWSEKNVSKCSVRQAEIIQSAMQCCRTGGHVIYSTCTYELEENDCIVELMLQNGFERVLIPNIADGIVSTKYGYQFYPHKIMGEGFYMAVVTKKQEDDIVAESKNKSYRNNPSFTSIAATYLDCPDKFLFIEKNNQLYAFPERVMQLYQPIAVNLYVRQAGILLGTIKGNDFTPSHELALSVHVRNNLPFVELNYDEAIMYLRCESLRLNTTLRGWVLARYQGLNLGWMKLMEGRINNYYPKEWRIRKQKS